MKAVRTYSRRKYCKTWGNATEVDCYIFLLQQSSVLCLVYGLQQSSVLCLVYGSFHKINVQHEKWQLTSDFSETWYTCNRY